MLEPPLAPLGSAFFFDFDGTLADLVERPDAVQVPADRLRWVGHLATGSGGALAVISGRPIAEIDHFLQPLQLPAAGVHGAERRAADGQWRRVEAPDLTPLADELAAWCVGQPGLLLERKAAALALHYRLAPEREAACRRVMAGAARRLPSMVLLHGKCVFELKPAQVDKGRAIESFLTEHPFVNRRPWFFGDDRTDEAGFSAVLARGGVAVKVGFGESLAPWRLADPAAVGGWIEATLAASGHAPHGPVSTGG
jgi:trehalose 6-phosphate phosphatase